MKCLFPKMQKGETNKVECPVGKRRESREWAAASEGGQRELWFSEPKQPRPPSSPPGRSRERGCFLMVISHLLGFPIIGTHGKA